ncbi:tRNA dimethylallyltransferase [Aricia agestis]|uniref:tRNA dimethylallyltransferase n=1 Tax=Aricia agestis TaxID=91739 RepID=UPI001C20530A|nr:tRNA dimethylallyltransferase [Aricia agestis]
MAFRTIMASKLPIVIILGATGTGKTKLGVELAQRFGSEVISADSMQIYKGLDIVTAKATAQERELVPHHLLDFLEPTQMFTVVDFRNRTLRLIDNLRARGKPPIVVGGTNYYIESIVYKILVEDSDDSEDLLWNKSKRKRDFVDNPASAKEAKTQEKQSVHKDGEAEIEPLDNKNEAETESKKEYTEEELLKKKADLQKDVDEESKFTNEDIHAKLKEIDPEMASRLHHNNRRKVLRSIEVWLKTGRRHSEVLDEQRLTEGQLRFPGATVILWLKCEQKIHDERLNARVDEMLRQGLIDELLNFHDRHNRQRITDGTPPDYTKGIFQTLGFKEFHEYLMLPEEKRNSEEGRKLLEEGIDNMKMATRRYARRQNKMVRSRFLEHPKREVPPIFELDTTYISEWEEKVKNKAIEIVENYLLDSPCQYKPLVSNISEEKKSCNSHSSNYCQVCERLFVGDDIYAIHLNSNKHKKVLKKKMALAAKEVKQPEIEEKLENTKDFESK